MDDTGRGKKLTETHGAANPIKSSTVVLIGVYPALVVRYRFAA